MGKPTQARTGSSTTVARRCPDVPRGGERSANPAGPAERQHPHAEIGNAALGDLLGRAPGPSVLDFVGQAGLRAIQRASGNRALGTLVARQADPRRQQFRWTGRIDETWTAALRRTPEKSTDDPHRNTIADLERGTKVRVLDSRSGWLHVEVKVRGELKEGYVSQELVTYVGPDEIDFSDEPEVVQGRVPTVAEAFVELKRAEMRTSGPVVTPSDVDLGRWALCADVLEQTGKYVVDRVAWTVDFKRKSGEKTQVTTIEDFILFVEGVEREYPSAVPIEIASEIRETWFADPQWGVLVQSQGIRSGGKLEDIETQGQIPKDFDMKQIAPNKKGSPIGGLKLTTPMGLVDVSHVMAGLDATLSGGMAGSYPESFLEEREKQTGSSDYDTFKNTAIYELIKKATGRDTRAFATWAGDLGQVYADFIFDRYVDKNDKATLADWTAKKMPREQLLGDIHGYIALKVHGSMTTAQRPTGGRGKVSDILRNMYLVPKADKATLEENFAKASGQAAGDLPKHIEASVLQFARLWFAKSYHTSSHGSWTVRPQTTIGKHANKFDGLHEDHKQSGKPEDQLDVLIRDLMKELGAPVR